MLGHEFGSLDGLGRVLNPAEPLVGGPPRVAATHVQRVRLQAVVDGFAVGDLGRQHVAAVNVLETLTLDAHEEHTTAFSAEPQLHPAGQLDRIFAPVRHPQPSTTCHFGTYAIPYWQVV